MNGRRRLLAASVISVQNSSFVYPSCQNCFSKLIVDSNRFNCLKCGCTGEAKDANYRYKLSLKVAGTSDLFDITVFGSSLEPFFGVTAGSLQRYIKEFNQVSGELDRDASPRVLIQAVKTCFIGRRFIFGVKSSENHDGWHSVFDSILPNCSRINRLTRDLTACQIFLPNTAVAGFTVISYFHRLLQSANFRSSRSSSQRPDCPFIAIDQPSSELSSLCSSGSNSCFVQSSGRESFSGPWQQSFGLTSSSVDWVTTEDFSSLELGKAAGEQCKLQERGFSAELCSLSPSNQTIQDLQLCNSMNERNEQEDNEFSSLSSRSNTITVTEKLESFSSLKREWSPDRNSSRLLQSPLDLGVKYSCLEIISRHDYLQEKSWNSLLCQRKDDSFCSSAVSPNHGSAAGTSQDDPMIWDELPFSESLNDFIARIENNKSTISPVGLNAHKCSLRERSELDENHSKTSCRQGIVHTACKSTTTTGRSPQLAENNDVLQNNSNHSKSSYNASADLFDASAREIETMVEFSNKSRNSSAQEDVLTEKYTASELVCSPLDVGCSSSECRSSLSLPPPFGKHSTPISYSLYDSELDLVDTQNFVPYSQSTPVARPLQKFRSQRGRESVLPKLTSKSPTKIHCKCKQSRPSFKNTLLRQFTSKFLKHKRSSNTAINKSVSQESFINSEVPENDSKEWIPPSATKLLQPVAFSNLKTVGLQARRPAICKPIDKKTISENKANSGKSRTDTCLRSRKLNPMNRAEIPTTPLPANAATALLLKDAVTGTCACSETQKSHSRATYLVGGLDEAVSCWHLPIISHSVQLGVTIRLGCLEIHISMAIVCRRQTHTYCKVLHMLLDNARGIYNGQNCSRDLSGLHACHAMAPARVILEKGRKM
ncbi:DNA damage-induced apoptosis suppressor protein [Emys orbicularis]|uniref:DNA damage-induced apoptosis suppressor protein n=1 Tax=Emys orbicularis TaxID=82168 RepID=UPI0031FC39AA